MKKNISKKQAEKEIEDFFAHIREKRFQEIKKIKRLAMTHNIKLGERRKLFCSKCYEPYTGPSIRIKNDFINIVCEKCGHKARWKFKEDNILTKQKSEEISCGC